MKLKTSLPDLRLENIDFEKTGRSVSTKRRTIDQLILVDPVGDEEVEELLQRLTMRSKEKKDYHSSDHYLIITFLLYNGFGNLNIYILL
jgi:hypothetical protein